MFKVTLTNEKEDLELFFQLRKTSIAKKWFDELCKNYPLHETDRFSNWNSANLISKLNYHIDTINDYDNIIDKKVSETTSQKDLNYLHKFFEDLRGEVVEGTTWFNNAPKKIQHSVEQFNVMIHQLEADLRTRNHPTIVVTFKDRPIIKLDENDLKYFTFRWTSGTVYIDYCQVGKTVLDIFKDKDSTAQGIRPQEYYSADFMIKFGPTVFYPYYLLRKLLISIWTRFQNFEFQNLNLGMIPVADLINNVSTNDLKKFNKVKKVECIA